MDELAKRLREDAASIRVDVSPGLDERIRASLEGVTPASSDVPSPPRRPVSLWLASSLTGVAAAAVVIVLINVFRVDVSPGAPPTATAGGTPVPPAELDLRTREAVLTGPLEEELQNLEADLKKAEKALREEFELIL